MRVRRKAGHCNIKLLANNTVASILESSEDDESRIDPDSCEDYINTVLDKELHSI